MRPKNSILILLLAILTACSNSGQKVELPITASDTTFPLEYIKQVSLKRKMVFCRKDINFDRLISVDSAFYKKWIEYQYVNGMADSILGMDYGTRYFFLDFKEFDNKFLFTILLRDEWSFNNLFHFTFNKVQKRVTNIDWIGNLRANTMTGEIIKNIFEYNPEGDILTTSRISINNNYFKKGYIRSYDSLVYRFKFGLDETDKKTLASINHKDTIWNQK